MVGPNRSIHHLDSISVSAYNSSAGLLGKCNLEIFQDCWAIYIETEAVFHLLEDFYFINPTTDVVIDRSSITT
jgi:hypothetical protein